MFPLLLASVLIGIGSPILPPIGECVDLIELNHKYAPDGKHTFSQVIFYERLPYNGKYRVRDWVLVDDRESLNAIPIEQNGVYVSTFVRSGNLYIVRSRMRRESWTQTDPEIEDARIYPKNTRRPLRRRDDLSKSTSEE
jgi:hypothetical protein